MILDVDDEARLRLLSSAVRHAMGRRTYVAPAVARMVETNAPRLTVADRRTLAAELDAAAGEQGVGDPVCDAPAWKHARTRLDETGGRPASGVAGTGTDLRTLMSSAFRHDMGIPGRAAAWPPLIARHPAIMDAAWRLASARDLYENGLTASGAPAPPIRCATPMRHADSPGWAAVYTALCDA